MKTDPSLVVAGALHIQIYRYQVPGYPDLIWDVTHAIQLVTAGQYAALVELPREEMQNICQRCKWDPEKLDGVNPKIPGIAAPVVWEGRVTYMPIDGLHRIARCLRDGLRFWMYCLTDEASRECLLQGDDRLHPWGYEVAP